MLVRRKAPNRPIRFFSANAAPTLPNSKLETIFAAVRGVRLVLLIFGATILICTFCYWWTAGIQPTFGAGSTERVTLADSLHFSVVTIATLGYGDYRPVGVGRIIAGIEVVAGITLMGVFVAKLVSNRQDRLASRMVKGLLNMEIQDHRDLLSDIQDRFGRALSNQDHDQEVECLYRASGLAKSVARYWRYEARNLGFTDVIPMRAASRLLGAFIEFLEQISSWVGNRPIGEFSGRDRLHVRNIADGALVITEVLCAAFNETGLEHSRQRAVKVVTRLNAQLQLRKKIATK